MAAFNKSKIEDIHDKNSWDMKQNRMHTQASILRMWAPVRGEVVTLPGQAGIRVAHIYHNITDCFKFPLYFYERDKATVERLSQNMKSYKDACGHFINIDNIKLVHSDINNAVPVPCEDLDFCATPGLVGRTVFARLQTQSLLPAQFKAFSFTTYEVAAHSNCVGDNIRLINNIIRFLDGRALIDPSGIYWTDDLHAHRFCTIRNRHKGPNIGAFCTEYRFPMAHTNTGRIIDGRWFRFRDKIGSISNTFAILYS
jgi:hypothetical protein